MLRLPLALFLFVFGSLASASAQNWVEYKPPGLGYRVEFPGTPKIDIEDRQSFAGPTKAVNAEYEVGPNLALLSIHIAYPTDPSTIDPQAVLDAARDGGVKYVNGKLREEKRLAVGGMPARRVVIDASGNNQVVVALFVVSGNRFYQMIAMGRRGQENSADVQRFIDSFALVPL